LIQEYSKGGQNPLTSSKNAVEVYAPQDAIARTGTDVWDLLRQGGFNLYFRHAQPSDTSSENPYLSQLGKEQAKSLGEFLQKQKIPIQFPVSASPLNRARQTAEIAFGQANVAIDLELAQMNKPYLLDSIPTERFNQVFVGHHFTFGGQIEPTQLSYLGLVVLKPLGQGRGYTVLNTIEHPFIQ